MKYKMLAIIIALLITRFCIAGDGAALDWSVQSSYEISPENSIISLVYIVQNLSEPGDANGMTSFTVEGGSNQGVVYASDTGNFVSQIFDNYTTYTGSVIGADGGNNTFSLYASYLGDPIEGTCSAISSGIETPVAFNDITVNYTAYGSTPAVCRFKEISTCHSAAVKTVSLEINITPFSHFPTFKIATATNLLSSAWTTNSTLHSVTGAVTSITLTNTSDCAFFKVIKQ